MEELLLRIDVFLRRSNPPNGREEVFGIGSFTFNFTNLTLQHANESKILTHKEAEVLRLLCENKNRVLKREEILKAVWGDDDYFLGRSMDVFISKLRKYLKDDSSVQIVNYHGVGFRLEIS
jgi:DNA-binding response OmpR family regulator